MKSLHHILFWVAIFSFAIVACKKNEDATYTVLEGAKVRILHDAKFAAKEDNGLFIPYVMAKTEIDAPNNMQKFEISGALSKAGVAPEDIPLNFALDYSTLDSINKLQEEEGQPPYEMIPDSIFNFNKENSIIRKGNYSTEGINFTINTSKINVGAIYLIPIRISSENANYPVEKENSIVYFAMKGSFPIFPNLSPGKTTSQSSTDYGGVSSRAIDGNTDGFFGNNSVTHTAENVDPLQWWQIDLGATADILNINIFNRTDCCNFRLSNFYIFLSENPIQGSTIEEVKALPGIISIYREAMVGYPSEIEVGWKKARYVRIMLTTPKDPLSLAEVEIRGKM